MTLTADVCVVGAGTAGAAAAAACAARGFDVVVLERGPLEEAGAHWVNGVPAWMFDAAGLARPNAPERRGDPQRVHLIAGMPAAGDDAARVVIDDHGVLEVDMRLLGARLRRLARSRGARLFGDVTVRDVRRDVVVTDGEDVRARWIVDASGLSGPTLSSGPRPRVAAEHLCAAAQEVRAVTDPAAARAFFDDRGVPVGEVAIFTGVAGGYSIINVRLHNDEVSLLTGSVPAAGHPSGRKLLDRFVTAHPWIGAVTFGGARAIPIRRPFDRPDDGRLMRIGDAASQVFPAHGSGIGIGLVAARELADALARGAGPRGYAVAFMRRWGGLLAGYDLFRRFSQGLSLTELRELMDAGLLDPGLSRVGMAQRLPGLADVDVAARAAALRRHPRMALRLGAVVARMQAARALYAVYPRSLRALPAWSRAVAALFSERPDA